MVKMTALVIGSFLVLYTPAVSLFILGFVGIQVPLWFRHLVGFALLMQGVTNSAVYCFRHEIFKQELKQFFLCFAQTSRGRSQTAASSSSGLSNLSYEKWRPSAVKPTLVKHSCRVTSNISLYYIFNSTYIIRSYSRVTKSIIVNKNQDNWISWKLAEVSQCLIIIMGTKTIFEMLKLFFTIKLVIPFLNSTNKESVIDLNV